MTNKKDAMYQFQSRVYRRCTHCILLSIAMITMIYHDFTMFHHDFTHDLTMLHHISNCLVIAEKSQVIVDGQNAQVFGVPPPMVSRALAELSSGMGHLVAIR